MSHHQHPHSLVPEAVQYLIATLEHHGNTVSADHRTAVAAIPELAEKILLGELRGRFRVGLPCGMGKTTAVRSILRAVHRLNLPYRLAVACSKVEELCALKRTLVNEEGIPADLIGLQHSYIHDPRRTQQGVDGYASMPSEGHDRQFLLVTHANVQSDTGAFKAWMQDRDLVLFDESLIVGRAHTLNLMSEDAPCVVGEWGDLQARARHFPELAPCAEWFAGVVAKLEGEASGHEGAEVRIIKLEPPDVSLTASFKRLRLLASERVPNLLRLLELIENAEELRVFSQNSGKQSLVTYRTTVPEELQNVIVLDASDPIRELVHHDARMRRIEDVLPSLERFRHVPGGISSVKHHARVRFHFASDAGGRRAMTEQFRDSDNAKAIGKLVRLIKSKPTESFLIFTYKDRDNVKFGREIIAALEKAGIQYPQLGNDGRARLNVETWGRETATNEYAHCDNVVLLGVVFQPEESIAGRFLGQVDDIRSSKLASELHKLKYGECAHSIYQAINRGRMRQVDVVDGVAQAKPCNVYVWHRDGELENRLAPVLRGVPTWQPWREEGEDLGAADVALLIRTKLEELDRDGVSRVSSRALKADVGPTVPSKTWKRARDIALQASPWVLSGSSMVRIQFTDETDEAA